MDESNYQYSKKIDRVIYGTSCAEFDGDDMLELAIAAMDQWMPPHDSDAKKLVKQIEQRCR